MFSAILTLANTIIGIFKSKGDIQLTRVQELHSHASVFWLSLLETVLAFLLIWNGVIAPNFHVQPIQTTFDATTLLFQLLGVVGVKHGVLFGSKIASR